MDSPRRLLHRWFVEYNPLYLLSAMLVLGGTIAMARGLGQEGTPFSGLAVEGIVEAYAIALIAGATLLYRVGHRRSAVMLAFLAALYQGDLMLHTETCPNLGGLGGVAAGGWLALFAAKLVALLRGLRLRANVAMFATVGLAAAGLVVVPWLDPRAREAFAMMWLFGVVACHRQAVVTSRDELDAWGASVLRRSMRALEGVWAALVLLHVVFWAMQSSSFTIAPLLALVPLVLLHRVARPATVAAVVAGTLLFVTLRLPEMLSVTAVVAAFAVFLRARTSMRVVTVDASPVTGPYRLETAGAPGVVRTEADPVAMRRLFVLAAACAWLSIWTFAWKGGPLPEHVLALDLAFTAAALTVAAFRRHVLPIAPVAMAWAHRLVVTSALPLPVSAVGWGATAVALGFVLLLGSLAVSYALRDVEGSKSSSE